MAQADEVDNSYLQVIFLHCMTVLLEQLKSQFGINNGIHPLQMITCVYCFISIAQFKAERKGEFDLCIDVEVVLRLASFSKKELGKSSDQGFFSFCYREINSVEDHE